MPISSTGYHYSYICDYYASYDACYETIRSKSMSTLLVIGLFIYTYGMVEF